MSRLELSRDDMRDFSPLTSDSFEVVDDLRVVISDSSVDRAFSVTSQTNLTKTRRALLTRLLEASAQGSRFVQALFHRTLQHLDLGLAGTDGILQFDFKAKLVGF